MNQATITIFGISNCDSVKTARAWFAAQGASARFHDFRKDGVPQQLLSLWLERLGWQTLLNRRGTTWRGLDAAAQLAAQDATGALALMSALPAVIKRPVVQWGTGDSADVTVGFDEMAFARALPRAQRVPVD